MATAMPRRRVNHCEMSAINGPNVADAPIPISDVQQRKRTRLGANPAPM